MICKICEFEITDLDFNRCRKCSNVLLSAPLIATTEISRHFFGFDHNQLQAKENRLVDDNGHKRTAPDPETRTSKKIRAADSHSSSLRKQFARKERERASSWLKSKSNFNAA